MQPPQNPNPGLLRNYEKALNNEDLQTNLRSSAQIHRHQLEKANALPQIMKNKDREETKDFPASLCMYNMGVYEEK